jgi:hypothetical protein
MSVQKVFDQTLSFVKTVPVTILHQVFTVDVDPLGSPHHLVAT